MAETYFVSNLFRIDSRLIAVCCVEVGFVFDTVSLFTNTVLYVENSTLRMVERAFRLLILVRARIFRFQRENFEKKGEGGKGARGGRERDGRSMAAKNKQFV